jgi:hypothetical protein
VHYEWVGKSLLKTFSQFFGATWTAELQNEWTKTYTLIAETMKKGAAKQLKNITKQEYVKWHWTNITTLSAEEVTMLRGAERTPKEAAQAAKDYDTWKEATCLPSA